MNPCYSRGAMSEQPSTASPPPSALRALDDTVYALEQMIVVCALATMSVLVFVDVIYRRLVSPDSAFDFVLLRVTEEGTTLYAWGGPALAGILGFALCWFAFATAARERAVSLPAAPPVLALITTLALGGLCKLMVMDGITSRHLYLGLYAIGGAMYVNDLRKPETTHRLRQIVAFSALTLIVVGFALNYMPEDYSWSKEFSLVLLLWVGFLGASICAYAGKHLRMEALNKLVPTHLARYITAAGFFATASFSFFLAWLGYRYIFGAGTGAWYLDMPYEQTGLPGWIGVIAVPIAFGIAGLRFSAGGISALQGGTYGKAAPDEGMAELQEMRERSEPHPPAATEGGAS